MRLLKEIKKRCCNTLKGERVGGTNSHDGHEKNKTKQQHPIT